MKKWLPCLLILLLFTGCVPSPTVPETTVPETTAIPETTVSTDPVDRLLEAMTQDQKVGQLFVAEPDQLLPDAESVTSMSDALGEVFLRYPVGGIVLFSQNIDSPAQLSAFTQALQDASDIPLFLAVDEEGGLVARLANHDAFDLPTYVSSAVVASSGNPEDALDMGRTIGTYLQTYGFNLNFAPVADVNTNPTNPVIGTRAFSSDPEITAQMASAFAKGLRENGVIATFKHFPGHGDTAEDSHTGLAVSHRTLDELEHCEFAPFRAATEADMVMVGHIALPEITGDMTPATLSPAIVTGILREELGFDGLIITDAMDMGAIVESYGVGDAAVAALQAGCHIILMPDDLPEAFDAVLTALEDGRLTTQWLDETVRKILEFKMLHGLLN